ncbi:MAG: hydroxyethylthiazole kinase [Turicibacter sp.]
MKGMTEKILNGVTGVKPLVHHITNYVTVNDCANMVLACGGSPIMADDKSEVEEITSICNSLVINIGTLNERTIKSMILAGKKANELGHPVILDPVGVGASTLRTQTTFKLLEEIQFAVIRGNISEIKTITMGCGKTLGVDANELDRVTEENLDETIIFAKALSRKTNAVIVITGAIDIVANAIDTYVIRNGHVSMSKITGTGCMLTSIIGTFVAANKDHVCEACAVAVSIMGRCGEVGYEKMIQNQTGNSSLKTYIIDEMSRFNETTLKDGLKIEAK